MNAKRVIPIHFATFPMLTGTPEAFRQLLIGHSVRVDVLAPGESIEVG